MVGSLAKPAFQPVLLEPLGRARACGDQPAGRVDVPVQLGLRFGNPERINLFGRQGRAARWPREKHSGHNDPSADRMTVAMMELMGMVLLDASRHDRRVGPATPVAEAPGCVFGIDEVRPARCEARAVAT